MNFSKSKVLLKKINAIHDSGASFENQLSGLEKDLLLQYLRDLYECVLDEQPARKTTHHQSPVQKEASVPVQKEASVPVHQAAKTDEERGPGAVEDPVPVKVEKKLVVSNGQAKETKKSDPELESLFAQSEFADLSQRFANTPIRDVSKAMGINEKILTINDLFKGNQQVFEEVVDRLNTFSSFDDAKEYLIKGIARTNDWAHKKNKQKAEVFVKLVRRRYL